MAKAKQEIEWGNEIHVASLDVVKMADDVYAEWKEAANQVRQMVNFIWQAWLVWHFQNGSREKIVASLTAYKAWQNGTGDKPAKLDLKPMSKELSNSIYHQCSERFPELTAHTRVLIQNVISGKITSRKAANGSLPGWWAILLSNESMPSTQRDNPIPFDAEGTILIPPANKDGQWAMRVRVVRNPTDGKSRDHTFELWSRGQKASTQANILRRIVLGEWKLCGSKLVLTNRGKWQAQICYRLPKADKPTVDQSVVAFLRPSASWPWRLRLPRRNRRPGGRGMHVGNVRQRLLTQRWSRQACYRQASSARKGHGRHHAQEIVTKLSNRWRDFVKQFNHQVATDVVRQCVEAGVGTLYYFQPGDKRKDKLFLATAGKVEDRQDSTSWDWYQMATFLAYRCQRAGIEFKLRKSGERSGDAKKAATPRKRKGGKQQPLAASAE